MEPAGGDINFRSGGGENLVLQGGKGGRILKGLNRPQNRPFLMVTFIYFTAFSSNFRWVSYKFSKKFPDRGVTK